MITGQGDPSADRPKLLVPEFMEWRGHDGRIRVPGDLSGAQRLDYGHQAEWQRLEYIINGAVGFMFVPLSALYERRGLPPVFLDGLVMSCES